MEEDRMLYELRDVTKRYVQGRRDVAALGINGIP